jgi:hypothetical protein
MQFSGQDYRQIGTTKQLSFLASGINFNNITGSGVLGFSGTWQGTGRHLEFKFEKGKIIDPENRYVYSYLPAQSLSLSGDIYDDNYQYYINDTPVCFIGVKEKNIIENCYIHMSGCVMEADLYINMDKPSYEFTQGTSFSKEGLYNINIKNNSSSLPFTLFSGSFLNENFVITNLPLAVETNSNIVVSGGPDLVTGDYEEILSLSTSAGDIANSFDVEVVE